MSDTPKARKKPGFPAADRSLTRAEHRAWRRMAQEMKEIAFWTWPEAHLAKAIPAAWDGIEDAYPVTQRKTRVTLLLDPEVAKFYRGAGAGYQARINAILAAYMYLRQSKAIEAREDRGLDGKPV